MTTDESSDEQKITRAKIVLGVGLLIVLIGIYARFKGLLTFYLRPWRPWALHAFNLDMIVAGQLLF